MSLKNKIIRALRCPKRTKSCGLFLVMGLLREERYAVLGDASMYKLTDNVKNTIGGKLFDSVKVSSDIDTDKFMLFNRVILEGSSGERYDALSYTYGTDKYAVMGIKLYNIIKGNSQVILNGMDVFRLEKCQSVDEYTEIVERWVRCDAGRDYLQSDLMAIVYCLKSNLSPVGKITPKD